MNQNSSKRTIFVLLGMALSAVTLLSDTGRSATQNKEKFFSAAELRGAVQSTQNGLAFSKIPAGAHAAVLFVRREKDGEVEVHEDKEDILVAHAGAATLLVGGKIEGNRQTEPGEWRGGRVTGSRSYPLTAGDMIWIPAGVPHQLLVKPGQSFDYLAFKFETRAAAP